MGTWQYILGGLAGLVLGAAVSVCLHRITMRKINKANNTTDVMLVSGIRFVVSAALLFLIFLLRNVLPFSFYATIIGAALGLTATSVVLSMVQMRKTAREEEEKRRGADKPE